MNQVLIGETTSDKGLINRIINLDNYLYMKYAPITSMDVVRSFFMYTNILSLNLERFAEDRLCKYLVVNFFLTRTS